MVWGTGGAQGVALELLTMMEPALARSPILTDPWASSVTVGGSRHPLHPLLCFGKWWPRGIVTSTGGRRS